MTLLWYILLHDYGIQEFKQAKNLHFKLKLEAGKPAGSNRSPKSNSSNRSLTVLF